MFRFFDLGQFWLVAITLSGGSPVFVCLGTRQQSHKLLRTFPSSIVTSICFGSVNKRTTTRANTDRKRVHTFPNQKAPGGRLMNVTGCEFVLFFCPPPLCCFILPLTECCDCSDPINQISGSPNPWGLWVVGRFLDDPNRIEIRLPVKSVGYFHSLRPSGNHTTTKSEIQKIKWSTNLGMARMNSPRTSIKCGRMGYRWYWDDINRSWQVG